MQRSHDALLLDIKTAAAFIDQFTKNMSKDEFLFDSKTQFAVCYQLTIIAEAVKKLPDNFKSKYPQIPWIDIIGMRNYIVHAYHSVDLEAVWNAIT